MAEKPEDLSLPASVVARIIKDALPDGVSVSKEARVAIGKAASVFVLYCTACSNNIALQERRKTLAATDVLTALTDMEFDEFTPDLKHFLEVYKREQKGKRVAAADRRKQKAVIATSAPAVALDSHQQPPPPTPPGNDAPPSTTPEGTAGAVSLNSAGSSSGETVGGVQQSEGRDVGETEEIMETHTTPEQPSADLATAVMSTLS